MGMSQRGKMALNYARRGWKVFPIKEGTKDSPRVRWGSQATNDSDIVRAWWEKWPDDNIGLACGLSNITVVDLDNKKGKAGTQEWAGLLLDYGWDGDTLFSETPSGGSHWFYEGIARTCQNFAGCNGVDIRGKGGYVLLPGSSYNPSEENLEKGEVAGDYTWGDPLLPMLPLPEWITKKGGPALDHAHDAVPVVELDQPHFISWAERFLVHDADAAVEREGGDGTTYEVACILRGRGLSEQKAFEMMLEHYNNRCIPPWVPKEMQQKVENAYRYASLVPPGGATAEAEFDDDPPDVPEEFFRAPRPSTRWLSLDEIRALHPPEWLVRGLLPMQSVGVLYGASQSFKSFFAFHLAACCSVGMPAFKERPCRRADTFYIAAEGGHGFKLRAEAWIRHFGRVPNAIMILTASVFLDREQEAEKLASEINAIAKGDRPRLIVVDTLSANFTGKENTDDVAGFFRKCFTLSQVTKSTVLVLHHTGKDGQREERGHYSIRANVDFSIKIERKEKLGAVVEVQKFKDAPIGERIYLKAVTVEVAPGTEFPDSLVLQEESAAAREFARADADEEIFEFLRGFDGQPLKEAANSLKQCRGGSVSTARSIIKKALNFPNGKAVLPDGQVAWLERLSPSNRQSGLIVKFARA